MVGLNDVYATICELVGIDVPAGSAQDSVSFARYLKKAQNRDGLRKYLASFQLKKNWNHAIRKGHLKLIHTPHNNTFEAYNLKWDLSESENIIDRAWVRKQIPDMFEKLKAVGPCPDKDHAGFFTLLRNGESRNCAWFGQNTQRCEEHIEGEMLCPSVCKRFGKQCRKKKMYGKIFV